MVDTPEREKYDVQISVDGNLGAELRVTPQEAPNDVAVVEHMLALGKSLHSSTDTAAKTRSPIFSTDRWGYKRVTRSRP